MRNVWGWSIGALALCGTVTVGAGTSVANAELEQSLIDVFKRYKCDECHVPVEQRAKDPQTGKLLYPAHRDFSYVLDLARVRASKYVVAGDPARSELYKLIVEEKMPEGAEFCFDPSCPYPPLTDDDRAVVEAWIRSLE